MKNRELINASLFLAIFALLLTEAFFYFETAYSLASIFRGARNVGPSDPLPGFVWWYVAAGLALFGLAVVYLFNGIRIRRWFVLVALLSLAYGIVGYRQSSQVLLSWSGIFRGDLVALGAASAVVFCALGIAGVLEWAVRAGRDQSGV
jgi:hypothetical protein